jgi:hypothetical protein
MRKINAFSIFGVMVLLACSTGNEPVSDVSFKVNDNNLTVENNTPQRIYYIALESEFATLVDWVAGFSGPYIESGKKSTLPYSKIANGKDDPVRPGDRILFYWWTGENAEQPDVHYESITLR